MHSHDRTLLAKLGFADADKKDFRHDLACQYLTTEQAKAGIESLLKQKFPKFENWAFCSKWFEWHLTKGENQYKTTIGFIDVFIHATANDVSGRSRNYIGDIVGRAGLQNEWKDAGLTHWDNSCAIWATAEGLSWNGQERYGYCGGLESKNAKELKPFIEQHFNLLRNCCFEHQGDMIQIAIEVKINPVPAGDIIRQIKLYQTYLSEFGGYQAWIVVTAFDISAVEKQMLENEGICHAKLGVGFEDYIQKIQTSSMAFSAASVEI